MGVLVHCFFFEISQDRTYLSGLTKSGSPKRTEAYEARAELYADKYFRHETYTSRFDSLVFVKHYSLLSKEGLTLLRSSHDLMDLLCGK